jgi:tRNA threonylcarbamoyl adenosine modification protein (Sua5/YciO/YrdC/YwlC family)
MISSVADIDDASFSVLKRIFPGPFTVLLNRNRSLPRQLKDKRKMVGIRFPNCPLLIDLMELYGKPIATASIPYEIKDPNPRHEEHLLHYGYEVEQIYGHALDLILDLGQPVPANETTILDLSNGDLQVVRQGLGILNEQ